MNEFEACRDAISLATNGRVSLQTLEQYHSKYDSDKPLKEFEIVSKSDIPYIRKEVDCFFAKRIDSWKKVRRPILLSLSEAVTNVIKHTPGGKMLVFLDPAGPRLHVIDDGTGIDLNQLPFMISGKGFSTSSSLGMGFTIMMRYMERITVCSSDKGTILVLETDLNNVLNQEIGRTRGAASEIGVIVRP